MADPSVAFVGPLERVLSLRALPMLHKLSADELAVIAQHTSERMFPKGTPLIDGSSAKPAAYVVVDGCVRVQRRGEVEEVGPGDSVGFVDLLAKSRRGISAQAVVDTQVLELDWDAQLDVCEQYFSIYLGYVQALCQRYIAELSPFTKHTETRDGLEPGATPGRNLNIVERAEVFRRSEIFARCSPDAIWELTRHVSEVRFEDSQRIWNRGERADSFMVVASGYIRCVDESESEVYVRTSQSLGMLETMTSTPRWYDAVAGSSVTALRIDGEAFLDILEDHFDMAMEYASAIARGVLAADSELRLA